MRNLALAVTAVASQGVVELVSLARSTWDPFRVTTNHRGHGRWRRKRCKMLQKAGSGPWLAPKCGFHGYSGGKWWI
jgi:hypothetical protein